MYLDPVSSSSTVEYFDNQSKTIIMVNPRLIAEDIAKHYEAKHNPHLPHAQNVRKYLRKPVLAITRRVLLPRMNYDDIDENLLNSFGNVNEQFGMKSSVDPTMHMGKEGLDWRDYLTLPGTRGLSGSPTRATSTMSMTFSMSDTETETEDERVRAGAGAASNAFIPTMNMKLSRRSISRMEAFLAGCALALPNHSVSAVSVTKRVNAMVNTKSLAGNINMNMNSLRSALPFGAKKKNQGTDEQLSAEIGTPNNIRGGSKSSKKDISRNYPQMHSNELILRLELYIRTIRRVYSALHPKKQLEDTSAATANEEKKQASTPPAVQTALEEDGECVIHLEPPRAIKTRIRLLIESLISSAGSVGSMHKILTTLLTHYTLEILAVELISSDLQSFIRKIVLEYEHQTSFASLAFLSTPEDSADMHLTPLVFKYVEYLKRERVKCVFDCRLESTLARAIDPKVRKVFKTVEFQSIGHLLNVCKDYEDGLMNIVISSRDASILTTTAKSGSAATTAAISASPSASSEDNGMHLLTDASMSFDKGNTIDMCSNTKVVKQALRDLRRETITINGQVLPPTRTTSLSELVNLLRERLNSRTMKLRDSKIGVSKKATRVLKKIITSSTPYSSETDSDYPSQHDDSESLTSKESNDTGFISSGCEGDGDTDVDPEVKSRARSFDGENNNGKESKSKRRIFNVDAIDILTRRLLIAASRTRGGGDAFFVV